MMIDDDDDLDPLPYKIFRLEGKLCNVSAKTFKSCNVFIKRTENGFEQACSVRGVLGSRQEGSRISLSSHPQVTNGHLA